MVGNEQIEVAPATLRALDQWLVWRLEPPRKPGGKGVKMPYMARATARRASSTGPGTWCPYSVAAKVLTRDATLAGLGFVFKAGGGLVGIDLDDSILPDGTLAPWAREVYDGCGLARTYVEVSPSLTGIKAFAVCDLPPDPGTGEAASGVNRKLGPEDAPYGGIEIYPDGRFFTVTGRRFPGTADDVAEVDAAAVVALYRSLKPVVERPKPRPYVGGGSADGNAGNRLERCWAYLQRCPDAISGSNGSDKTLRAACECLRFGLGNAEAAEAMRRWNEHKCDEKWTEAELAKKLKDAEKHAGGERGRRLQEDRRSARRTTLTLSANKQANGNPGAQAPASHIPDAGDGRGAA